MKQLDLLSRFVHFSNAVQLVSEAQGVVPLRFDPVCLASFPPAMARIARMNTGVELILRGTFKHVEMALRVLDSDGYGTSAEARFGSQKLLPVWHLKSDAALVQTQAYELPQSTSPSVFRFIFPTHCTLSIQSVSVDEKALSLHAIDSDATVPTRWLVYGDSITQGANVSVPSLSWPALAARIMGWQSLNLAIGGYGIAEPQIGAAIANRDDFDVVSLHMGANAWMGGLAFMEALPLFLAQIRRSHPTVPILIMTPLYHPSDVRGDGDIVTLRKKMELLHASLHRADANLYLISGLDVLPTADGLLVDNLHLEDFGAIRYAQALAKVLPGMVRKKSKARRTSAVVR